MTVMNQVKKDFKDILRQELIRRCQQNPRYSLRAFARILQTDPSDLSKMINGKKTITQKATLELAGRMGLNPADYIEYRDNGSGIEHDFHYQQLLSDTFMLVSDWYYYAILELFRVDGFQPQARNISSALGITIHEATDALERLERLGFISQEGNIWKSLNGNHTTIGIPGTSGALKKRQRQILNRASEALDEIPPELRDQSTMTMAIDASRINDAKDKIKNFRRELCSFLESGKSKDEVYELSISLFPVSKVQATKNSTLIRMDEGKSHENH